MRDRSVTSRWARLLRWYPDAWRRRYGDEVMAFMDDTYGDGPVPARVRLDVVRGALSEHGAQMGLGRRHQDPAERLRGGSLLILSGWAFFVVGGSVFAKATEGWDVNQIPVSHGLAFAAFEAVLAAAAAGAAVILLGATVALPGFLRYLRSGGWSDIRRPIIGAGAVTVVTVMAGSAVVVWARHLVFAQRNGADWPYSTVVLVLGALFVLTVAAWTVAALRTVTRLGLPAPVLRAEGVLALLLLAVMAAVTTGTVVWWATVATEAPRFLSGSPPGASTTPVTSGLLIAGLCMVAGLGVALRGAARVAGGLRPDRGH